MDGTARDGVQRGVHACRGFATLGRRHEHRDHLFGVPLPFGPRQHLGRAPHQDMARPVAGTRDLSDDVLGHGWRERVPEERHVSLARHNEPLDPFAVHQLHDLFATRAKWCSRLASRCRS